MTFGRLNKDESFGMLVSFGVHAFLLMLAFLVKLDAPVDQSFAFIEVAFGDFQMGRPTDLAEKQNEAVATAKNPSVKNNTTDKAEKTEAVKETETAKSAELSKQTQDIKDETVINTPKSEKVNPEKTSEIAKKESQAASKDAKKAEDDKEGAENSGSVKGKTGNASGEQGSGDDEALSAPYQLVWDGDIVRKPLSDLKPAYAGEVEAVIVVKFQVRPDGTVGQMIPIKKGSPELEREVFKTLRTARFSPLPTGAPQLAQWGTITFRFVLE